MIKIFKQSLKRFLKASFWIILLLVPFVILSQIYPTAFRGIHERISEDAIFFAFFRWGLILVLASGWRGIIYKIARLRRWKGDKRRYWLSMKWRILCWLVVLELLICENVLCNYLDGWLFIH